MLSVTTAAKAPHLSRGALLHPEFVAADLNPAITSSPTPQGVTPSQMRHFYGVDSVNFKGIVGDGSGQTIAIVDAYDDPTAWGDLLNFDAVFHLPDPTLQITNQYDPSTGITRLPGTDPAGKSGNSSWEIEASLDVQWAHVIAPKANLILVEADSAFTSDLFAAAAKAASLPGVVAVSMSFGGGDTGGPDNTFTTPSGHTGVTFLAATGDHGSPSGYPAYSPNVVAVGGTVMQFAADGRSYGGETGWSGSGGGFSSVDLRPSYQTVQTTRFRSNPDVSMDAAPQTGVPVYDSFDFGTSSPWARIGGTSLATPMWAALIAIADQGRASQNLGSLDGRSDTLPSLYSISQNDFHDITSGSNGGFTAGPGYDEVTGRGTPVANVLLNDLAGVPANPPVSIAGRYVFYNNSVYDGKNPAANAADDGAIATDKQALLPGGIATFANYTSYSKGINGIMVDVSGLPGTPTASDFTFNSGTTADPSTWTPAPAPAAVLVRPGAGTGGSTRIEVTWADGSIRNQWLQVSLNADAITGLTAPDLFYFGNLYGESGKPATGGQFTVTADDVTAARNDSHTFLNPAGITDNQDYNRDGRVDAIDQLIARQDAGATLVVLSPPVPAAAAAAATAPVYTSNGQVLPVQTVQKKKRPLLVRIATRS